MKNKIFTDAAWQDYLYWEKQERKTLKRINILLENIDRNGNAGIGRPEPLLGDLSGFFSRRINIKDRLIYSTDGDNIYIVACRSHYDDR